MKPLVTAGSAFVMVFAGSTMVAQERSTVSGTVITAESRSPVRSALVTIAGLGRSTYSDAQGRFTFTELPSGRHIVIVRALGYRSASDSVLATPAQAISLSFSLERQVLSLDEVVVTATAAPADLRSLYTTASELSAQTTMQIGTIEQALENTVAARKNFLNLAQGAPADWFQIDRLGSQVDSLRLERTRAVLTNRFAHGQLISVHQNAVSAVNQTIRAGQPRPELFELAEESAEALAEAKDRDVGMFLGDVRGWRTAAGSVRGVSGVATGVLLFPDKRGSGLTRSTVEVLRWVGIAAGVVGGVSMLSASSDGGSIGGFGLTAFGLSELVRNSGARELVENVGRNVTFTDDIVVLDSLAQPFNDRAKKLWDSVRPNEKKPDDWLPTDDQLTMYYSMIVGQRELMGAMQELQTKARYLIRLGPTEVGRGRLTDIIVKLQDAADSWRDTEPGYLATYNVLKELAGATVR